jgi:hypothetical protein
MGFAAAGLRSLEGDLRGFALLAAAVYGAGMLASLPGLVARRPRWVWGSATVTSAVAMLLAAFLLHPALAPRKSAAYLIEAVPELRSDRPVVVVEMKVPSLTLYLDRIPDGVSRFGLERRMAEPDAPLFVIAEVDFSSIPAEARSRLREVGRQGKFVVFQESDGQLDGGRGAE